MCRQPPPHGTEFVLTPEELNAVVREVMILATSDPDRAMLMWTVLTTGIAGCHRASDTGGHCWLSCLLSLLLRIRLRASVGVWMKARPTSRLFGNAGVFCVGLHLVRCCLHP